ncbi:PadR family transcriptional regulator [Amycolatopsis sp.]|jgi:DNA-binding PadR family transcriptional regulator|uniref:PadR family transcriptional regulator n=1 Tax=Amycolatopsis sp. TaxID=37632 RepID=UPI002E01EF9E|nr:helix-turn-helix transcriptional regulator [Amycolatopsis sp.]
MRSARLKGHLDALVLAVLADQPAHGYAILTALKLRTGNSVDLEGGTLYPTLHRLEAAGLISSDWSASGGRRRRVYTIEDKGRRVLADERSLWQEFVQALQPLLGPPLDGGATR